MSIFNASRLLGKTVLITGASAGIGAVRVLLSSSRRDKLTYMRTSLSGHRHIVCKGTSAISLSEAIL
jgi:short-subunit dehydrogenase